MASYIAIIIIQQFIRLHNMSESLQGRQYALQQKICAATYDKNCINSMLSTSPSSALGRQLSPVAAAAHSFTACLADDCNNCCWSCSITRLWLLDCECTGVRLVRLWLLLCRSVHVPCPRCCSWAGCDWLYDSEASVTAWLDCNTSDDAEWLSPSSECW